MKATDLEKAFIDYIRRHDLLSPPDEIIVATSGGVDSMVLLHLFHAVRDELGCGLGVAHVNHGLRGAESDGDEEFVRRAAEGLGLSFHLHRCDPGPPRIFPGSLQERARSERYAFFERLREGRSDIRIATAHHADDNAETVLFNFLRGTGVRGLSGIPVVQPERGIIRPLLFAEKRVLTEFASLRDIGFREDPTNAGTKYTRNVLRHDLIPRIADRINPGLRATLNRTAALFTDLGEYLRGMLDGVIAEVITSETGEEIRIDIARLNRHPLFLREAALHELSRDFTAHGSGFAHIRAILDLTEAHSGAGCRLGENFHVYRDREQLIFVRSYPDRPFLYPVRPGEAYEFGLFSFSSSYLPAGSTPGEGPDEIVDGDLLDGELVLRSWNEGDWFIPLGMDSRKKLSDFFIDRKIPVPDKKRIPILLSGDAVVWVCGLRIDARFRVTTATRRPLKLSYTLPDR